jgi:hypothetical protein
MLIATQRPHRATAIPTKRGRKTPAGGRISGPLEVDKLNPAKKVRRKSIFGLAGHQQYYAGTFGRGHRKQKPSAWLEPIKP